MKSITFVDKQGNRTRWTIGTFCYRNGVDHNGAKELIAQWVAEGKLKKRPDGAFDVIRHIDPKNPGGR